MTICISSAQNYKSQFKVSSSGKVENDKGAQPGYIEADGTIRNSEGEIMGKVSIKNKEAELFDKLGKKIGTASSDRTLKDIKGKVLFRISVADENGMCKILDASGKEVGIVHKNYKQQGACIYHCLGQKKVN